MGPSGERRTGAASQLNSAKTKHSAIASKHSAMMQKLATF